MKPPGIIVVMYLDTTIPQGNFARLQFIEMQVVTARCLHREIATSEVKKKMQQNNWKFAEDNLSFSDFADYLQKIYLYSESIVGLKYRHKTSVWRFFHCYGCLLAH